MTPSCPIQGTNAISYNVYETYGLGSLRIFPSKLVPIRSLIDLGSSPFARHYLGNDYYFLFLRLLRCFSSPGLLASTQSQSSPHVQCGGFPHSEICGSKVACHLTAAYRRLLRPSSLSYVKASTVYSC